MYISLCFNINTNVSYVYRYVTCCCFSKNDQFIATASGDKTVVVWAVTSKLLKGEFTCNVKVIQN